MNKDKLRKLIREEVVKVLNENKDMKPSHFYKELVKTVKEHPDAKIWFPSGMTGHDSVTGTIKDAIKQLKSIESQYKKQGDNTLMYYLNTVSDYKISVGIHSKYVSDWFKAMSNY